MNNKDAVSMSFLNIVSASFHMMNEATTQLIKSSAFKPIIVVKIMQDGLNYTKNAYYLFKIKIS